MELSIIESYQPLDESVNRPVPYDEDVMILEALTRIHNVGDEDTYESFKKYVTEEAQEIVFEKELVMIDTAPAGYQYLALTQKGIRVLNAARNAIKGLI